MVTKLHINAAQGIIDVEGDIEFVKLVYSDFKDKIDALLTNPPTSKDNAQVPEVTPAETKIKPQKQSKRIRPAKRNSTDLSGKKAAVPAYKPTLDTSAPLEGLAEFYKEYTPKNNSERILLFCKFLQNSGITSCTADQIYTCFMKTDPKNLPKAYSQAIIDTRGRGRGYIEYKSLDSISVSHLGEHHLIAKMSGTE